jgi:hypothetical protein
VLKKQRRSKDMDWWKKWVFVAKAAFQCLLAGTMRVNFLEAFFQLRIR